MVSLNRSLNWPQQSTQDGNKRETNVFLHCKYFLLDFANSFLVDVVLKKWISAFFRSYFQYSHTNKIQLKIQKSQQGKCKEKFTNASD